MERCPNIKTWRDGIGTDVITRAQQVILAGETSLYSVKCHQLTVQLATDWETHTCFKELPVWLNADKDHWSLRFLVPGSRLLLNSSQPESCLTDSEWPPGYQTIEGEWVALNPQLHILTSPREEVGDLMEHRDGSPYLEGILYRWAEYHPRWFRQRLVQHRLGTFDLHIFNGKVLQEGSNIQEYREFLRSLETTREWPQVAEKTLVSTPTLSWMTYLGIGSAIILVGRLGCQCWYNGIRVLKTRGPSTTPGLFCKVLCCGMAALLEKPDYRPVTEAGSERV